MASSQIPRVYSGTVISQGGPVFQGDVNAGGNITINQFNKIPRLALDLYRSCSGSSNFFHQLPNELAALLVAAEEYSRSYDADQDTRLHTFLQGCLGTLEELKQLKADFDSVGSRSQMTWERMEWRAEELSDIRSRLTYYNSLLTGVNTEINRLEKMVQTFIDEVQSGRREGSVLSFQTAQSLTRDEQEWWRQIRRELEDFGITPALSTQHRAFIIAIIRKAMGEGFPDEDILHSDKGSIPDQDPVHRGPTTNPLKKRPKSNPGAAPPRHSSSSKSSQKSLVFQFLHTALPSKNSLAKAATAGNLIKIRRLMMRDADVNKQDDVNEQDDVIRQDDVNKQDGWDYPALYTAARSGHKGVVQEKGGDIDRQDEWGRSLLYRAAHSGCENMVRLLLEKGANVDRPDKWGYTTLYEAACHGHEGVVRLLLEKGTDVDRRDEWGHTALYAAVYNSHEGVARLLLEKGADIDIPYASAYTSGVILWWAAEYGHLDMVRLLLEKGAEVGMQDKWGPTALFEAVYNGHEDVVRLLLQKGVHVDRSDESGRTALHYAVKVGRLNIIRVLLEHGANIN